MIAWFVFPCWINIEEGKEEAGRFVPVLSADRFENVQNTRNGRWQMAA